VVCFRLCCHVKFLIFKFFLQSHYFTGVLWYDMCIVLVQVKLSLCLIKYQAYETMELKLRLFLSLTLDRGEWLKLRLCRFASEEKPKFSALVPEQMWTILTLIKSCYFFPSCNQKVSYRPNYVDYTTNYWRLHTLSDKALSNFEKGKRRHLASIYWISKRHDMNILFCR
jgi:hypothetical protein